MDMPKDDRGGSEPNSLWKNRYRIEKELGRGGFGVVFLARDEQLRSKHVVLKVLQSEATLNPYLLRKFQQEIEALARIDHPGVVGVLDVGDTPEGTPFIAMQFVEGVTLRQEIRPGGMNLRRVSAIVRQMCNALAAAHEKGICHRDLKPENIMLTRSSETEEYVRLIDFGLAAVRDSEIVDQSAPSMVAGTLSYMAPEQALGKGSPASDTYALGAIAFEMLTGRKPEVSPEGVRVKPREIRPAVPDAAEAVILKALSYLPEVRPASPRHFADQFCGAFTEDPSAAATLIPGKAPTPSQTNSSDQLELAHVLFTDIVGYSKLPIGLQSERIQQLQRVVTSTAEFRRAQLAEQLVLLPTGDGMALVFFGSPVAPAQCAMEISRALKSRPELELRMGVHTGPVYRIADINKNQNVAGGGINIAQRVMDCGDAGHVLLSRAMADILGQLDDWIPRLHDLGEVEVKHGVRIHVVNLFSDDFGNPAIPAKLPAKSTRYRVTRKPAKPFFQSATRRAAAVVTAGALMIGVLGSFYWYMRLPKLADPVLNAEGAAGPLASTIDTPTGRMMLIPEGQYLSGSDNRPARLPAFYIDQTEVTNEAFARFCAATKRDLPPGLPGARPDFPVVNVTINEAREYAKWAGKRLPSLGEWEKAARGPDGKVYPWGNDTRFTGANVGSETGPKRTLAAVNEFASADSSWGVRQMAGNVWELVDELRPPTVDALNSFKDNAGLRPPPTATEAWYLIVGGSFESPLLPLYEFAHIPGRFQSGSIGFRCVKDAR
jgi:serine/threonine protein kinase/formylglycine-generating enzyme required for sulfatase activity